MGFLQILMRAEEERNPEKRAEFNRQARTNTAAGAFRTYCAIAGYSPSEPLATFVAYLYGEEPTHLLLMAYELCREICYERDKSLKLKHAVRLFPVAWPNKMLLDMRWSQQKMSRPIIDENGNETNNLLQVLETWDQIKKSNRPSK